MSSKIIFGSDLIDVLENKYNMNKLAEVPTKYKNGVTIIDFIYGNDCLKDEYSDKHYDWAATNPPFSYWNSFVEKSKEIADNVIMIGRTNYFGAYNRYRNGLWNHLKTVYIF